MAIPTPAQLITAVTKREWDTVRQYIADGADINGKIENSLTPLLNAINGNMLDGVALLLELGADPDKPHKGKTALTIASQKADNFDYPYREVTEILIKHEVKKQNEINRKHEKQQKYHRSSLRHYLKRGRKP